jgi:hypothetical protein
VRTCSNASVIGTRGVQTLSERIRELLKDGVERSAQTIAMLLYCRPDSVRRILNKMVASGEVRVTNAGTQRCFTYCVIASEEVGIPPRKESTERRRAKPREKPSSSRRHPDFGWPAADPALELAMRAMVNTSRRLDTPSDAGLQLLP